MYDRQLREEARRRIADGEQFRHVAAELGVALSTVFKWTRRPNEPAAPSGCWRCDNVAPSDVCTARYVYVLGQYLGDGHLVTRAKVPVLSIFACTDYPGVADEILLSLARVRGRPPGVVRSTSDRMVKIQSYWMHWPCMLPQHGPGRKHHREIVLAPWQTTMIRASPWPFLRGLFHSDGCRVTNTVRKGGKSYSYGRWMFANESADIMAIMGRTLDSVGVEWRFNRPNSISVAKRASVAMVDKYVGLKKS